jgi:hypothetical protein
METELADFDEYEVQIYDATESQRLVAAIELISPANKDRPAARQQFVSKCAALLRQDVCVVLVDVIGSKDFNLYKLAMLKIYCINWVISDSFGSLIRLQFRLSFNR